MNTPSGKKGSGGAPRRCRLRADTLAWLGERSGLEAAALPFAEAVTLQLARRGGAEEELGVARRVVDLLRDPTAADAPERLSADPELHSSFFQNADLLFEHAFAGADAVGLLVMRALEDLDTAD